MKSAEMSLFIASKLSLICQIHVMSYTLGETPWVKPKI